MPRGQGRGPRGGRRARGASVPGRAICAARLPRSPRRKPPRAILVSRRGTDTRDKKRILTAEILNRGVADAQSPRVLPGSAWSRDPHVFEEMPPGRPVGPTCPGGLCPGGRARFAGGTTSLALMSTMRAIVLRRESRGRRAGGEGMRGRRGCRAPGGPRLHPSSLAGGAGDGRPRLAGHGRVRRSPTHPSLLLDECPRAKERPV